MALFSSSRRAPNTGGEGMPKMTGGSSLFSTFRSDFQAACLEFVGTTFFLTLAFGGVQAIAAEANEGGGGSFVDRDMKIAL
ncbi:hypothetical protein EIP91_004585, partial [Steccherinum ochraceum]